MTSERSTRKDDQKPAGKLAYQTPSLTFFGTVRDLTQSGTGAWPEGSGMVGRGFPGMGMGVGVPTGPGKMSDRRVKTDILRIDDHPAGFGIYLYAYDPDGPGAHLPGRWLGVMSDEVRKAAPDAVHRAADGYDRVDYAGLGIFPRAE